jgi:hypothetical protein
LKLTFITSGSGVSNDNIGIVDRKYIAELIRTGYDVMIKDREGYDVTKEIMVEYSLGRLVQAHDRNKKDAMVDILCEVVPQELLETIVACGGFENYLLRKRKNLL